MKRIYYFLVASLTIMFSGCSSYQYTSRQISVNRQDISTTPTIVDVKPDYSRRIEVTSDWNVSKDEAMNECRYMALTNEKIDVVVDPIFKIEYNSSRLKKRYKATLIGYAGFYNNFRTLFEDIELFKKFNREEIENYLLLKDPTIIQYLNAHGDVINVIHSDKNAEATGSK